LLVLQKEAQICQLEKENTKLTKQLEDYKLTENSLKLKNKTLELEFKEV